MSLLNKNINDITYADIEQLVNVDKPAENEFLDYKSELPRKNIHELIAAFANTYGGWIIVGVSEDPNTNKPKEIIGVEEDNLSAFIESICIDRISPPVFCQCRFIENDSKDKRVFVIRVDESDLTPHAVDYNTTVYIKIKEQKRPYKKADLDEIEWLKNRRQRFEEKREFLINRCKSRCNSKVKLDDKSLLTSDLYITVKYPQKKLISDYELFKYLQNFKYSRDGTKPLRPITLQNVETANDCIINTASLVGWKLHYTEFNGYGLHYNKAIYAQGSEDGRIKIDLLLILSNLITNIFIATEILKAFSFNGNILLNYNLRNIKDKDLITNCCFDSDPTLEVKLISSTDNEFLFKDEQNLNELLGKRNSYIAAIIDDMVFSFGGGITYKDKDIGNRLYKVLI